MPRPRAVDTLHNVYLMQRHIKFIYTHKYICNESNWLADTKRLYTCERMIYLLFGRLEVEVLTICDAY